MPTYGEALCGSIRDSSGDVTFFITAQDLTIDKVNPGLGCQLGML